jgi:hypothetical protein
MGSHARDGTTVAVQKRVFELLSARGQASVAELKTVAA